MISLKEELTKKYLNVLTYLNSGNVVFESSLDNKKILMNDIKLIIKDAFNLDIPVFIITYDELSELLSNQPDWWNSNDKEYYHNLIFIIPPTKYEDVYNVLNKPSEGIEKIKEYNNAIFWSYKLKDYTKANWWIKTASTSIKDQITIRTANTIKKLIDISK